MSRLSFDPVFGSYLLVAAAALLLLGLLVFCPAGGRMSGLRRAALIGLRLAVIVLVVLALLWPRLIYTEFKRQSATLVVLIDQSQSMSVPDAGGGKTRWQLLQLSVDDAQAALAELAEDFQDLELKAYTFDVQTYAAEVDRARGKIALPETPEGKQTAIGAALEDVLRPEAGKRLLGVILLSDGAQRAYAPRNLPPQTAAGLLQPFGAPLYTLAFGQSRGLGEAKDVAVAELLVNQNVFVKNQLAVAGQVRVDGYVNRRILVKVLFETSPGEMDPVAAQTVMATDEGQLLPIELSYAPQVPGEYKLTLEAVGQTGELVTTNNRLSTFVNVLGGGLSVLYLEGTLRPETTFLRRALDASPDINVLFQRIDPQKPETRPGEMTQWFLPGKYDVYILGDLHSKAFQGDELENLAKAVSHGSGLIMLGGLYSFGPGGYATTPLADILPVEMNRFERQEPGEPPQKDLHLPGPLKMQPTRFGALHFVPLLAGTREENLALWDRLPPLGEGANRFRRLKPLAVPLIADQENRPLLVAGAYDKGRVMAFAGDSTWRWQTHGYGPAHKRFWRQIILWLARKDQAAEGDVWVRLAQRRFAPSEPVEFTMGAQSPSGEPVTDATFEAEIVLPDGKRLPLEPVREDEQMTGTFRQTDSAGDYAIKVTATHEGTVLGSARARFLVFEQNLELDNAAADRESLESLAKMTGGQSLAPEELSALIKQLTRQTESLQIPQQSQITLWTEEWWTWSFFLALVALLGVEWYLRKRWGLV
jgi:hypothetical protein